MSDSTSFRVRLRQFHHVPDEHDDGDEDEDDEPNDKDGTKMILSGTGLPASVATLVAAATVVAVAVSGWSIYLQLKNYRKPALQR